jgi:predicted Zn-dependent peptidase
MFFKGAKIYKNAREVSEAIDSIGGEFNAFTGKQYAGYFVKVAASYLDTALEVLSDMVLNSRFEEKEIEKEKSVILEEYKMYQDTPTYQIGWDFERLLYGDQPMGYDQLGTPEFLNNVRREDLLAYHQKLYTPDNMVISIVGGVDHKKALDKCEKLFLFGNNKKSLNFSPILKNLKNEKIILRKKYTKQGHIVVGFEAYSESHPKHWSLKVLSVILGGNMSSRMFLSIRDKKGLAYNIITNTDDYTDSGIISTRAAIDTDRIEEAMKAIIEEYFILRDRGLDQIELNKAKSCLKGKILLKLEDTEEFSHLLGKYQLLYGQYKSPEEILAEIDKVTLEDVNFMTKDLFKKENLKVAIIGPFEEGEKIRFEKIINEKIY